MEATLRQYAEDSFTALLDSFDPDVHVACAGKEKILPDVWAE